MKPSEFKRKAKEEFGVVIDALLIEEDGAVKIAPKEWMHLNQRGVKAEPALTLYKDGYKHAFFTVFSKKIRKNIVEVGKEEMGAFFSGKEFPLDIKDGTYALSYKGHIFGGALVREGKARPILNKGLKREII